MRSNGPWDQGSPSKGKAIPGEKPLPNGLHRHLQECGSGYTSQLTSMSGLSEDVHKVKVTRHRGYEELEEVSGKFWAISMQ